LVSTCDKFLISGDAIVVLTMGASYFGFFSISFLGSGFLMLATEFLSRLFAEIFTTEAGTTGASIGLISFLAGASSTFFKLYYF